MFVGDIPKMGIIYVFEEKKLKTRIETSTENKVFDRIFLQILNFIF